LGVVGATIGVYEAAPRKAAIHSVTPPGAPSAFATSPPVGLSLGRYFLGSREIDAGRNEPAGSLDAAGSWRAAMAPLMSGARTKKYGWIRHLRRLRGGTEPVRTKDAEHTQSLFAARSRSNPCLPAIRTLLCVRDAAFTLDRDPATIIGETHPDLPEAVGTLRPQAPVRHHAERANWRSNRQNARMPRLPPESIGTAHVSLGRQDLLDTAGIATTYGAEPFRNRKPQADATVVRPAP